MLRMKAERDAAAEALANESDARAAQQSSHESLIEQWRHALEIREKDMEDLQERLQPPRDLELLRVQVCANSKACSLAASSSGALCLSLLQIAEELSSGHATRVAALEADVERFRSGLYELQRCYEGARAEHAAFTQDQVGSRQRHWLETGSSAVNSTLQLLQSLQAREAESTHMAHRAAVAELQRTIASLQVRQPDSEQFSC
jgi:hypothetical protein